MAQARRLVCGSCHRAIEAWSDGNPYYLDEAGVKQYAYHPNHERLALCIGNDVPYLCLGCGAEFKVDSRAPTGQCPRCGGGRLADTYQLDGRPCPFCKAGAFAQDPDFFVVS